MIPQSYPLFICEVPMEWDHDRKSFEALVDSLNDNTIQVIAWFNNHPIGVKDGQDSPHMQDVGWTRDFDSRYFFGDKRASAVTKALKFLFKDQMPSGWETMIKL